MEKWLRGLAWADMWEQCAVACVVTENTVRTLWGLLMEKLGYRGCLNKYLLRVVSATSFSILSVCCNLLSGAY